MKDLIIHTFKRGEDDGDAFYSLISGKIYISDSEFNITHVLWHEIMHKILNEEHLIKDHAMASRKWDNIAYRLEIELFYQNP